MNYRTYLLISQDHIETVKEFVEWSLKGYTSESAEINDNMILIDTTHDYLELKSEFDGLDVKIIEVTYRNIFDVLEPYGIKVINKVYDTKKEFDISEDINHFLELINTKGSIDRLNGKERQRLYELTKK